MQGRLSIFYTCDQWDSKIYLFYGIDTIIFGIDANNSHRIDGNKFHNSVEYKSVFIFKSVFSFAAVCVQFQTVRYEKPVL